MLKKFFISLLGSMAAIWLSFIILIFGTIIAVGILVGKSMDVKSAVGDKILVINLKGVISERGVDLSLADLLTSYDEMSDDLATTVAALSEAKGDKSIKGVYIDCGGSEMGMASRLELIEALRDFKESGKWVYAYADNYDQGDYYVASVADKVCLNPVGSLNVHGLSSQVIFFTGLMQKLGVGVQVVKVGDFKSAVEPYLRTEMSPESRLQTEVFLNSIWGGMKDTIAVNRGMETTIVDMMADSLSFTWAPQRYLDNKAVTQLCYRSEIETMMRDQLGIDKDEDMPYITPSEYMSTKLNTLADAERDHIAVLYAVGDIVDSGEGGIVGEDMVPEIQKLTNNDKVKGMVLRVNSPGGSAFASEQIWKALEDFKATGKALYVSMGDYAASGGYYISCGADKIYADPSTLTGSIGIFGIIPNGKVLLEDKLGLSFSMVETNANANFPTIVDPMTPQQYAAMQAYVERGYETFVGHVADGRNLPVDSVKAIGGGRVWDGVAGVRIGLVDELGSLQTAIDALNKHLGKDYPVVSYPDPGNDLLASLIGVMRKGVTMKVPGMSEIEANEMVKTLLCRRCSSPLQARMPLMVVK